MILFIPLLGVMVKATNLRKINVPHSASWTQKNKNNDSNQL